MKRIEDNICEVLNLAKIKSKCPQIIKECECCGGTIIDDDNVPEKYIVDYNDRQIYSAVYRCVKCSAEICENCIVTIDDNWERINICKNCYEKYKTKVDHILKLQKKAEALAEDIADEIMEFLDGST